MVSTDGVGAPCGKSALTPTQSGPFLLETPGFSFWVYQFGDPLFFPSIKPLLAYSKDRSDYTMFKF